MVQTLSARRRILAVLCGGFFGTLTRYGLSTAIQGWLGKAWPYDILIINLTGALALAFVTTLADATFLVGPTRRLFINTGFLGAYTTFSSLALGDILLFSQGSWISALAYITLSLCGGIGAVLVGDWLGRTFLRCFQRPARTTTALPGQQEPGIHIYTRDELTPPEENDEFERYRTSSPRGPV